MNEQQKALVPSELREDVQTRMEAGLSFEDAMACAKRQAERNAQIAKEEKAATAKKQAEESEVNTLKKRVADLEGQVAKLAKGSQG